MIRIGSGLAVQGQRVVEDARDVTRGDLRVGAVASEDVVDPPVGLARASAVGVASHDGRLRSEQLGRDIAQPREARQAPIRLILVLDVEISRHDQRRAKLQGREGQLHDLPGPKRPIFVGNRLGVARLQVGVDQGQGPGGRTQSDLGETLPAVEVSLPELLRQSAQRVAFEAHLLDRKSRQDQQPASTERGIVVPDVAEIRPAPARNQHVAGAGRPDLLEGDGVELECGEESRNRAQTRRDLRGQRCGEGPHIECSDPNAHRSPHLPARSSRVPPDWVGGGEFYWVGTCNLLAAVDRSAATARNRRGAGTSGDSYAEAAGCAPLPIGEFRFPKVVDRPRRKRSRTNISQCAPLGGAQLGARISEHRHQCRSRLSPGGDWFGERHADRSRSLGRHG